MTLQRRVLAYLVLAVLASGVLTVGLAVVLVRHHISAQRTTTLSNQADSLASVVSARAGVSRVFRVTGGRPVRLGPIRARIVARFVPEDAAGTGTVTIAGRRLLYAVHGTSRGGRVIVVRSGTLAFAEWRPFLWAVVLAGLGGALVAALLAVTFARRLARPIDRLSDATRRLAAGERDVAVPVEGGDELARLGDSFNAMAAQLAHSRDAQRNFLESVSHELKTPLTAIRGYGEALQEGVVAGDEAGPVIAAESERLERLVGDLLELARFGRADFTVARSPIDLAAIAADAVSRHAPRARELGVALSFGGGSAGAGALGDAQRLLQATSNLVENALRLTPAGGEVRITVSDHELVVSDSGPGLAAEDLTHAFERFYLHRRYRSERAVGSGLGLAIVRELVEAMGGRASAANGPEGGAEFTLSLPPIGAGHAGGGPAVDAPDAAVQRSALWAAAPTPESPARRGADRPSA